MSSSKDAGVQSIFGGRPVASNTVNRPKPGSWSIAEQRRRAVETRFAEIDPAQQTEPVKIEMKAVATVERTVELFLTDKKSQGLDAAVLKKYERELKRFTVFMTKRSRHLPHEIRLEDLTEYRATWRRVYPSSTTRAKVQERLRALLRYCYESELIDRIPKLSPIKVDEVPTLPLSELQYADLLRASHSSSLLQKLCACAH